MPIGINVGDIIGYISKSVDPKGYFLREAKVTSVRICKAGIRVYSKEFRPFDLQEIQVNTAWLIKNKTIVLIQEPILLTPELKARLENWCKLATQNPEKVERLV